jgi:hypothetical protein
LFCACRVAFGDPGGVVIYWSSELSLKNPLVVLVPFILIGLIATVTVPVSFPGCEIGWIRPKLLWIWLECWARFGIRLGLGIVCAGNVRWVHSSLNDPLLGCEIYLFPFLRKFRIFVALPVNQLGRILASCTAQLKDSFQSPCLSYPFLPIVVSVKTERGCW